MRLTMIRPDQFDFLLLQLILKKSDPGGRVKTTTYKCAKDLEAFPPQFLPKDLEAFPPQFLPKDLEAFPPQFLPKDLETFPPQFLPRLSPLSLFLKI